MIILWLPTRFRGIPTPGSGLSEEAKRLLFGSPLGFGESRRRVAGSRREQKGYSLAPRSVPGGPGAVVWILRRSKSIKWFFFGSQLGSGRSWRRVLG